MIYRAAKQYWEKHLFEYFNVDSSSVMNDLSLRLLQEGRENKTPLIKGVYYRQFLPAANVTIAYFVYLVVIVYIHFFRGRMT